MSQPSSQHTRQSRSFNNRDKPIRHLTDFVTKYLGSTTGQRLLNKQTPKLALAFQEAIGE